MRRKILWPLLIAAVLGVIGLLLAFRVVDVAVAVDTLLGVPGILLLLAICILLDVAIAHRVPERIGLRVGRWISEPIARILVAVVERLPAVQRRRVQDRMVQWALRRWLEEEGRSDPYPPRSAHDSFTPPPLQEE